VQVGMELALALVLKQLPVHFVQGILFFLVFLILKVFFSELRIALREADEASW
jgi:hypothetical protein